MIRFIHVPKSYGTIEKIAALLNKVTSGRVVAAREYDNQYRIEIHYSHDFSEGYWGQEGKSIGLPVAFVELGDDEYDPDFDADYGACSVCAEVHNLNIDDMCKTCADATKGGL